MTRRAVRFLGGGASLLVLVRAGLALRALTPVSAAHAAAAALSVALALVVASRFFDREALVFSLAPILAGLVVGAVAGSYVDGATALAILAGLAVAGIYVAAAGWVQLRILVTVFVALIPFLAAALLVIVFVILNDDSVLYRRMEDTSGTRTALIAGTVIATGWLATAAAAEAQRARAREQDRVDLLIALRSEIFTSLETLDRTDWRSSSARQQKLIEWHGDGEGAYIPFVSSESPPIVYDALSGSIGILRPETIEPILRFYTMHSELRALAGDFARPDVRNLEWPRRVALHRQLSETRRAALFWALRAVYAINLALDLEKPEDIPRSGLNPDVSLNLKGAAR